MKLGKRAKAKKYAPLRQKQHTANTYIKQAQTTLRGGKSNFAIKRTKAKLKQFYNSRGLRMPSQLSFKSLSKKDLEMYEQLLDSIINDTFINPDKYAEYRERMRDYYDEQISEYAEREEIPEDEIDDFIDIMESDIVRDILNLGITPSELARVEAEYMNAGLSTQEFYEMLREFMKKYGNDGLVDQFFTFADEWAEMRAEFNAQVDAGMWDADDWQGFKDEFVFH